MQSILEQITDWLKSMIISGIMGNLSGMFDLVNQQVGQIAGDVGTTPANFSPAFFSMIRNILESVLLPIAGMVLTFIACYELIQMLIEHTGQNYLRSLFALGSPYKHRILRSEISAGCPSWVRRQNSGSIFAAFMAFAIRVERVVGNSSGCCQPILMVKLPCGSASTNRTFLPSIASPMPRFSQVVVLPVPPFWLTMAIVVAFFEIFITPASLSRGWFGSGRKAASWWVRCTEKRADIVSCFGLGCCSLQGTSAQNGYGRRSAS